MTISIGSWALEPSFYTFRSSTSQAGVRPIQPIATSEIATKEIVSANVALRESLSRLQTLLEGLSVGDRPRAALAESSKLIGLSNVSSAATLTSSEEANTQTTAFDPVNPAWQGTTTIDPTISGIYNGDQGTGTLTFDVRKDGVRGVKEIRIDVLDPNDALIERIDLAQNDPVDTQYTLSNGLVIEFSAGFAKNGDTFTVNVQSNVDVEIDPDAAFDGSGGNPRFDPGETVTAGSFLVNGTSIDVQADDTVNSVLARITSSAAGVTATYDSASESVVLTQKTPGSGPTITVSADTSGFLSAVKLDDGTLVPGTDADIDQPMSQVAALSGVSGGSLIINGVSIAIDPATDSLSDLVPRIDESAAGVTALVIAGQRIAIRNESASGDLVLDSNGTGFFEAAHLASKTYELRIDEDRPSPASIDAIVNALRGVATSYNALSARIPLAPGSSGGIDIRSAAESAFASALQVAGISKSELGFELSGTGGNERIEFRGGSTEDFRRAIRKDFADIREFFLGSKTTTASGFVGRLISSVNANLSGFPESARIGVLVDTFA